MSVEKSGRLASFGASPAPLEDPSCPTPHVEEATHLPQPGDDAEKEELPLSILDLKTDGLLAVFDRLSFEDRLHFRITRELAVIEKDAAPIDVADDRTKLKYVRYSVTGDQALLQFISYTEGPRRGHEHDAIPTSTSRLSLPLAPSVDMLVRVLKTCFVYSLTIELPSYEKEASGIVKALRFANVREIAIRFGVSIRPDLAHSIDPLLYFFDRNGFKPKTDRTDNDMWWCTRLKKVNMHHPEHWFTLDNTITLIQEMLKKPVSFLVSRLSLDAVLILAKLLMGVDSAPFDDLHPDLSTLRTTFRDREVSCIVYSTRESDHVGLHLDVKDGEKMTCIDTYIKDGTIYYELEYCYYERLTVCNTERVPFV